MPPLLRPLLRLSLVLPALLLAGCDTEDLTNPGTILFDGVTYTALGGARLEPTAGGLVVHRGDGGGEYGVAVDLRAALDGDLAEAAFLAEPVDLPAGGRWGLQLFGEPDGGGSRIPVATVWSDAVDEDTHAINFNFDPATGVETVTLEYYLDGQLQHRVPGVPLVRTGLRVASAGEGEREPQSVHVIRDGSIYIVATDYGGSAPRTGAGGCSGALLRVSFPGVPAEICTDYVQAVPEQFGPIEAVTGIEIRARVLDRFTLTGGDVR